MKGTGTFSFLVSPVFLSVFQPRLNLFFPSYKRVHRDLLEFIPAMRFGTSLHLGYAVNAINWNSGGWGGVYLMGTCIEALCETNFTSFLNRKL